HRALADATDPDVDPDRRAWHHALGSRGPDEEIAQALERSADRARARGGLAASAALLERSVALTGSPTQRSRRILAAAAAHQEAGSFERSNALLADAPTAIDAATEAQLEMLRARNALFTGDPGTGALLLDRAARQLESVNLRLAYATHLQAIG